MSEEIKEKTETEKEVDAVARYLKWGISLFCIFLAVVLIVSPLAGAYNALIDSDLQVQRADANIRTDLERRADLLPNLAEAVKGSAYFEKSTLTEVIAARAGDASVIKNRIKGAKTMDEVSQQEGQLQTVFGGIMTLNENYPTLQTTQQFREFGAQVTATENEILMDRQTYNAAVMQYQSVVRSFPTNLIADHYGFNADRYHSYMPANMTRAESVPVVTFGTFGSV